MARSRFLFRAAMTLLSEEEFFSSVFVAIMRLSTLVGESLPAKGKTFFRFLAVPLRSDSASFADERTSPFSVGGATVRAWVIFRFLWVGALRETNGYVLMNVTVKKLFLPRRFKAV